MKLYIDTRTLRNKTEKYHFDTKNMDGAVNLHKALETCYEKLFDIMHEIAEVVIVSINEELTPTDMDVYKNASIYCGDNMKDIGKIQKEVYEDIEGLYSLFIKEMKDEENLVIQNILQEHAKVFIDLCGVVKSS